MNTKVKIGIAIAIVTALIALIVLDQSTSPTSPEAPPTATTPPTSGSISPRQMEIPEDNGPSGTSTSSDQDVEWSFFTDMRESIQKSTESIKNLLPEPATPIKGTESIDPVRDIPKTPPATADEYVIQPGDTYEAIAKKKYGKGSLWNLIAKANPDVKAYALRVGKKILLPARPGSTTTQNVSYSPTTPASPTPMGGGRIHQVQPGDTLSGISKKYFNTVRHQDAIYQANKGTLHSPDALQVGMKLQIPSLKVRSTRGQGVVETSTPAPKNGTLYTVKEGDKLWTIAKNHRGNRGIMEVIRAIVSANPTKLRKDTTPLRIGWKLVIPN